jgi:outer membrane receptor protein involved in Fe transport
MTFFASRKASSFFSGSALALSAVLLAASPSAAQDAADDEIIVTGSRIPQDPNLISSVPVQSLDDEDIRLSGEISLAEIVNDIPALISSTSVENSVSGGSSLNLRGLGGVRTLTLVNGRRHVAGFRGTSAVDVSSIPRALVESAEVTTGGASAIYGADAVTGVVNFILKDDFEGFEADVRGGISTHGDAENFVIDATYGTNFADDRGNVVLSVSYVEDTSLTNGDRSFSRDNNIAVDLANPALRLQASDLGADTPNFNGLTIGSTILGIDTTGLTLTSTEQALIDRATNAPARIIARDPRVWLSSQTGSIAPGFGGRGTTYVDLNNNGIADCQESRGGQIGFLAGCWVTGADGQAVVFEESLIADTSFRGVGNPDGSGSGGLFNFNRDTLYPETDSISINLNSKYDLAPGLTAFFEGKYVMAESETFGEQDSFYDTLFIAPDNPFIPANLLPVVEQTGGLLLTQDPTDLSDNNPTITKRETLRFVGGLEWETESGHNFEVSVNHGRFKNTQDSTEVYLDRQFAATDAVVDPNTGEIVCRSDLDPTAFYEIDYFTAGNGFADGGFASNRYYSFTPGDGQCQPLNPFGLYSVSQEAQDFVTANVTDEIEITQTVLLGLASGQFDWFENLLDGPVGYAAGLEYRRETSEDTKDPLRLGVLPQGSSLTPGVLVNTIDPFLNTFISIDNDQQFNTSGDYDVAEAFGEIRVPIFRDQPFAKEFTLDAAVRHADYSTLGGQTTWKVGGTWAPYEDLSIRGTISSAVRAPNISELFDPELPIQIGSNEDPCDPGNVGLGTNNREANCIADLQAAGVAIGDIVDGTTGAYIWQNPLTGRFTGTSGGNPDLQVETADTKTIGAVYRPSYFDGFSLTVDYWEIDIENAISAVAAGDILEGCYDSGDFPNVPFCGSFERRSDGGLSDLSSGQINFAQLEASGVDFAANYSFDMGENTFGARLVGSYQEKLDRFFNPLNLTEVDPELQEVQRPELSGNLTLSWDRGPYNLAFQTSYQSKQSVDEIEDIVAGQFGDAGFFGETFVFDVNGAYELSDSLSVYGGVNNITDKDPFSTQTAWPVGPRGRFVFLGVNYRM